MEKGLFITFEGIDGCGKSTQIGLLESYLKEKGKEVLLIREPGGTAVGEKIREILLEKKNDSMKPLTELLLFEAARAQITEEKIIPATEEGKVVICDRFFDSTTAYQGYAREMGTELTDLLNGIATAGRSPDITFVLDIDPEQAYARRVGRGGEEDRMEALGLMFQQKVREGYLKLASDNPRVRVIDASATPEEISEQIKGMIDNVI
ncbi:MAG: dTMP kinase [Clostridiales bacterium]|nr:dTMP kinase [Clostridiales bacterium]